ncbi:MAG: ATP-binding protein [Gallionellaceae bacterium]|nr:ATP-binding protein [Gallionellaceae bacterium]
MKLRGHWLTRVHTLHRVVQVDVRLIALQTLLFGAALSALLTIPVAIYNQAEARNLLNLRQAEQERAVKLATQIIHLEMDTVLSDLRYLSQHNELTTYLENNNPEHRRQLALEYRVLAKQKRIYDKIRFIGLDGMEEVRVDFADGQSTIQKKQDLQDKHDRYYFQETLWLSPGQIYVSPLDLNVEHGAIEHPVKPTIRFAVPVADSQGQIRGMVVLNYLGQRLLSKLSLLAGSVGDIWLLNAEGYWLIGPTREDEWGFMFPSRRQHHVSQFNAPFWQQASVEKSGTYRTGTTWIRFERIFPLAGSNQYPRVPDFAQPMAVDRYYWTLAVAPPQSATQVANTHLQQNPWLTYAILSLFAYLMAGGLSFAINRNKALAESLEKVIDSLPALIAYVDAEQRYRFNNKAYEGFFGLSPARLYGSTLRELLGEDAYQKMCPYVEEALAGKAASFEYQLVYPGMGMRDLVVDFLPDTAQRGEVRGFFLVANDVSLVKQSERGERRRMLELAQVSRLASMGEMATEIAHEINQPLAAIAMYSAAGLRTLQSDGDRGQIENWLEAINSQSKRASEIVRRVRRFVQKGEHQRGPVALNLVAGEVAALLRHEAQSQGVEIILQLAEDLPSVQGEVVLLEQVVFNLVRNALDALPPLPDRCKITLATSFDAKQVYVEVMDTGSGVDPILGERVFDSFVSSKQEGVGMGLTISRSIIEAHGGKLRYLANPEGGATFMFSLPREAP